MQGQVNTLLESGVYEPLPKDATARVEKSAETPFQTQNCSSGQSKMSTEFIPPQHVCGIPKVHKPDIPLRSIVSFIGSPGYALAGILYNILSPLAGRSEFFVKNSAQFIQLLKSVNIKSLDTCILVSFDISLFTNVPGHDAL
jgi:hypothetical protein